MIKRLLSYVREYKKAALLTPCFMILEVLMEMTVPKLLAALVDDGIGGNNGQGDVKFIILMGLGMVVAALIGLFAGIMGGVFGAKASIGFAKNLRKKC